MAHKKLLKPGIYNLKYSIGQNAWFVKAGAIIPLAQEGIQNLQEPSNEWRIFLAPGAGKSSYCHYEDDGESQAYPEQFATTQISKNATGSGVTVEIGARNGSYKGMQETRKLSLVLGGLSRCPSAFLGGTALPCSFNAETLEAQIELPETPANQPLKITVKY